MSETKEICDIWQNESHFRLSAQKVKSKLFKNCLLKLKCAILMVLLCHLLDKPKMIMVLVAHG